MKTNNTEKSIVRFDGSAFNSGVNQIETLIPAIRKLITTAKSCEIDLASLGSSELTRLLQSPREFLCSFLPSYKMLAGKVNINTDKLYFLQPLFY